MWDRVFMGLSDYTLLAGLVLLAPHMSPIISISLGVVFIIISIGSAIGENKENK